ncbi:LacI family DNA-binding transcriptional regulator [Phycicoccus sp.]|uniref:LacI family DNA-binding transcriptional regulator n=1 Tax=Phycicoccus sp. TaxID=1902410 RepID=UPI002C54823D|nr:LacI family DNA-binding transcriptional regulator [Phycicoccus sp.]HMM95152.1 LacI family DNA-binding transcriptional regulator [Phycicoccus sp.]
MTPHPPDGDRVTIHDVARAAGVSRQTVSNAVNNPDRVRADTLERVRAAIDELGYHPSSSAQSLRNRRAGAIGVELHTLGSHNATTAPVLTALSLRAARFDCHVVPFGSETGHPMLEGYRTMWAGRLVDAFLLAETHHGDPRPPWLEDQGIPYATFGRVWDDPTFTRWVDVDGGAGTRAAVEHCLTQGYRRVGFLGWPSGSVVGDDRREGWHRAAVAADALGPEGEAEQDLDDAVRAATGLLGHLSPGDAVVCASDVLALGVHHAAVRAGLEPGADLGIVGFDGSETASMHHLTSVAQPFDAIAEESLRLVSSALVGDPAPDEGRLLLPTLTTSRSTRA